MADMMDYYALKTNSDTPLLDTLIRKTIQTSESINRSIDDKNEYLIISDFGKSSVMSAEGFVQPYFRIFEPVKPEKGRKLSKKYDSTLNVFKDSLMDYPVIAAHKLGRDEESEWEKYNRLISVHISRCPIDCWHCYLEECLRNDCIECSAQGNCSGGRKSDYNIKTGWYSAKKIIDDFLLQRNSDLEKGIHSNILRITGGEPFLAPKLIIEILDEIGKRELQNDILLWTETNLIPFCTTKEGVSVVSDEQLSKLGEYNNLCIHPCFHGLSKDSFYEVTGTKIDDYDSIMKAFERLVKSGIDIYPTFGSNMTPIDEIEGFYNKVASLNSLLPLRFCLIEYDLNYTPVNWRNENIKNFAQTHELVYDRYKTITKWDALLGEHLSHNYGETPRHLIKIDKDEGITNKSIMHLFKWPALSEYQRIFLQVLSMPIGAKGVLRYRGKYVNNSFVEEMKNNNVDNTYTAILWVLNQEESGENREKEFKFAHPIRYLTILSAIEHEGLYYIEYIAREFISTEVGFNDIDKLKATLKINFGCSEIPKPGAERGFAFAGPNIEFDKALIEPTLQELYNRLKIIPNLNTEPKQKNELKEYPFFRIVNIVDNNKDICKKNDMGQYLMYDNKSYFLEFMIYQPEEFRNKDREVCINGKSFYGVQIRDYIALKNIDIGDNDININVKCCDVEYNVPIKICKKVALFNRRFTPLITMLLLVLIATIVFFKFVNFSQDPQDNSRFMLTFFTPLTVLLINSIVQIFQQKKS